MFNKIVNRLKFNYYELNWNIFIQKNKKDHFSIEHIYPQTPDDEYWHEMFKDYNDNEIKYLTKICCYSNTF